MNGGSPKSRSDHGAPAPWAATGRPAKTSDMARPPDVVDREDVRVLDGFLAGKLVDAEHQLHRVGGRLPDGLDVLAVDRERDVLRRPVGGVDVRLAHVDGELLLRPLLAQRRVAEGVDAHADACAVGAEDVAAEDLDDADLARALRLVLEADHPQRDHRARVGDRAQARLDATVAREVEAHLRLRLADDRVSVEGALLAEVAADRAREHAGLQRGDAQLAVPLRAPRRLVLLDQQPQPASHLVARGRSLAAAPLRQVVRQPPALVQLRSLEVLIELPHRADDADQLSRRAARWSGRPSATRWAAVSASGSCVVVTAQTVIPAARPDSMPAGASSNTTHAAGATPSRSAASRCGSGAGLPFSTWSEVTSTAGSGRPAAASRARASGAVHEVAIATCGSASTSAAPGIATTPSVSVVSAWVRKSASASRWWGGTCSARTARAGRPWLPAWIAAPSSPWRSPHLAPLRTVGARESISTPSRSEMTATKVPGASRSPAARRASANTTAAARMSVVSAHGSETASASTPMIGGPIRKPNEPIEATAAIAGPAALPGWRPAALNISGTPFATPRPTANSPISAAIGMPISSATPSETPVSSAPACSVRTGPSRPVTQSPTSRPVVMPAEKTENVTAAIAALAPRSPRR